MLKAIDLLLLALPSLDPDELNQLKLGIEEVYGNSFGEVIRIWREEGRLRAVKYYYDKHRPLIGLKEAKDRVDEICKGITYKS